MSLEQLEQMVRAANPVTDVAGLGGSLFHREQSLNSHQVDNVDLRDVHTTSRDDFSRERHPGRRWMVAAAASLIALGLLAATAVQDSNRIQTGTVPPTTRATTPPPPGEEITVTRDLIQFGDRLVGVNASVVTEGGRTYVPAGHFDGQDPCPDSKDLVCFSPETFVLAAFDDAGVELWRTELDWFPGDMVLIGGDLWVARRDEDRTVTQIDASDGRILGQLNIRDVDSMVEAFGWLWVTTTEPSGVGLGAGRLVRIDPDQPTSSVEQLTVVTTFAECVLPTNGGSCPDGVVAGAGAVWLPLGHGGVAVIDPVALGVTVIPVDDIGHEVLQVAFDGDVAFVASNSQVTSIVDGEVVATFSPGQIHYLGPIEGAFGVLLWPGTFQVLRADDPMLVETRQVSLAGETGGVDEIDGDGWLVAGRNYNRRRVEFLPSRREMDDRVSRAAQQPR